MGTGAQQFTGTGLAGHGPRHENWAAADAGATDIRIDEQRLHVRAIDQHEAMGLVMFIDSNSHRRMRQKLDHFGINCLSIIGTEEVMGGVYGATPKVNQGGTIFRT